jgi:hypothetical protein
MVSGVRPLWRALAGVEAGVVAGGVMLAYLALDAVLRGSTVWSVLNLYASNFYGPSALGLGFRRTTVFGLAWHVGSCGLLGLGIALLVGWFATRASRFALLGALAALGWYYLGPRYLWPLWNPLAVRQPFPGLLFGHLIFGVAMGVYPRLAAELGDHAQPATDGQVPPATPGS